MKKSALQGFSLVELVIVIAIIAVLSIIGLAYYGGILQRTRDATRLDDLVSLNKAILAVATSSQNLAADLCFNTTAPCQGSSYPLVGTSKRTDGTGWIPINFDSKNIINLPRLPLDPTNDASHSYGYFTNGSAWRLTTTLESDTYKGRMIDDGGIDVNKYEVGFNMSQLTP